MTSELSNIDFDNFVPPQPGGPHFKSSIRTIRASGYTLMKCLNDLMDNAIDRSKKIRISFEWDTNFYLDSIIISDDSQEGFSNILHQGTDNPFNMSHMRTGHEDDNQTSEFGTGMKQAAIACCNKFEVVTRVDFGNNNIQHFLVEMDFNKMAGRTSATQSFNPTVYTPINENLYKQKHIYFDTGSTIRLSDLTDIAKFHINDIYDNYGVEGYEVEYYEAIKNNISLTYGQYIKNNKINITISKGETQIEEIEYCKDYDLFEDAKCIRRMIIHNIYCNIVNYQIQYICIKQTNPNRKHHNTRYFKVQSGETLQFNNGTQSINESQFNEDISNQNIFPLTLFSTCIDGLKDYVDYLIINGKGKIFINRNLRNYSVVSYRDIGDGYSNHTYNLLTYDSKKLNKFLGVTFNKDINHNLLTPLTKAIKKIQHQLSNKSYLGLYKKENRIKAIYAFTFVNKLNINDVSIDDVEDSEKGILGWLDYYESNKKIFSEIILDLEENSGNNINLAMKAYAKFHNISVEDIVVDSFVNSSAGFEGWLKYYTDHPELFCETTINSGESNSVTGESNDVSGESNSVTSESNDQYGDSNGVTGESNGVTGESNNNSNSGNETTTESESEIEEGHILGERLQNILQSEMATLSTDRIYNIKVFLMRLKMVCDS